MPKSLGKQASAVALARKDGKKISRLSAGYDQEIKTRQGKVAALQKEIMFFQSLQSAYGKAARALSETLPTPNRRGEHFVAHGTVCTLIRQQIMDTPMSAREVLNCIADRMGDRSIATKKARVTATFTHLKRRGEVEPVETNGQRATRYRLTERGVAALRLRSVP